MKLKVKKLKCVKSSTCTSLYNCGSKMKVWEADIYVDNKYYDRMGFASHGEAEILNSKAYKKIVEDIMLVKAEEDLSELPDKK